jgi:hypothetical protein
VNAAGDISRMSTDRSVPRVAGWVPVAIVIVIFVASSVVPFMQAGEGWPAVGMREAGDVALLLVTWLPFIGAVIAWFRVTERFRQRSAAWVAGGHLALFVISPPAHAAAFLWIKGGPATGTGVPFQILTFVGALQYLVIVAVMLAVSAGIATNRARLRAAELEMARATLDRQLADARLETLTARLQPHFLFNTLNSISVLSADDPAAARQMIARLSDLLRAVLMEPAGANVAVSREIELVTAYVDIQRVRFGDRLHFAVEMDPRSATALVPPFILQPLAENAVEHAISSRTEPGRVVVRTAIQNGRLSLSVSDDGVNNGHGSSDGHGIGLRATRDRLAAVFGDASRFELVANEWGGRTALIEIPAVHA